MDLDALREALAYLDGDWTDVPADDPVQTVYSAARAVLDSEEAWWCKEHGEAAHITDDSQTEPDSCDDIDWKRCRVVRVRLLAEEGT